MPEQSEDFGQVFDETSLHQEIIKTWGEHGAHNDVFTSMRSLLRRQRAENERLRRNDAVLREALARACEDGWTDGAGAFDSYVRQAEAALAASPEGSTEHG
jgi:hypothetical protein